MLKIRMIALSVGIIGALAVVAADAAPEAAKALPVTVADHMRAAIEVPAQGIWGVQFEEKLSDDQWRLLDQDATALAVAAGALTSPGTGKADAAWARNADWQSWTGELQRAALELRTAARAKDQDKLMAGGDRLQEVCQGCHAKYRPQTPSDGVTRYPYYPKRELPPSG